MKNIIVVALKGMAMGIAEVVPGVSGGTIAFITGIYERLLLAIKSINPSLIKIGRGAGIKGIWKAVDGTFLTALLSGMVLGLLAFVQVISYLIEHHPEGLWGFFFGLILASVLFIGRQVKHWDISSLLLLALATVVAFYLTIAAPAAGIHALWFVFLSGAIAISAMILPGVSGSFLLLVMGMYTYIIPTLKEALDTFATDKLIVLGVFLLGCLTGLLSFVHLVSWAFKRHRKQTLAILTGFMAGSLNKVWPWKNTIPTSIGDGPQVASFEKSVWPSGYEGDPKVWLVLCVVLIGFLIVFGLEKLSRQPN